MTKLNYGFLLTVFVWMLGTLQCSDQPRQFGLIIGDSHAAAPTGWAHQLQKLRPQDSLYNFAVSGNTIGFDNLGRKELNELRNIHYRLAQADNTMRRIDYIVILLRSDQPRQFGLIIGDSHAAAPTGWAHQLQKLRPQDSLYNFAVSGNTIGFDNLGRKELNELRNIHYRLAQADNTMRRIDYIVILL